MSHRSTTVRAVNSNRPVTIQHATPRRNVRSIFLRGLLPALARGKLKAVWLHASNRTDWATAHVARRHHVQEVEVVVLVVRVPRSWLRRNRRGVWYCAQIIDPDRIASVNGLKLWRAAS